MIIISLLLRLFAFGFRMLVMSSGMVVIIIFGFEIFGLNGDFNPSNPLALSLEIIIFGLALSWFMIILAVSYCPRCKFIIAWSRLNKDWLSKSLKGNALCPKCGNKGLK